MPYTFAIFSALYPPHIGGIEAYTQNLAAELEREGNRVIVVTSELGNASAYEIDENGITILRTPNRPLMGGRFPVMRRNEAFRRAMERLDKENPDFVVVNARFYPLSVFGAQWARSRGIVPVIIDHGSAHLTAGSPLLDHGVEAIEHLMTNLQKRAGGVYYGVSKASCAWLRHFRIEARGVLANSIDAERFRAQASERDFRNETNVGADETLIAFVGRLEPEKGPDALMQALDALASRNDVPAVHAVFAGEGSMRPRLEERAAARAHLVGALGSPDVASLLLTADALCLPTRSEGFSTSLLEAAACGCAPVITDVGGVAELVADPSLGTVLPDASPEAVAAALARCALDRAKTRAQGAAVQMRVEQLFTWKRTACAVREACIEAQQR